MKTNNVYTLSETMYWYYGDEKITLLILENGDYYFFDKTFGKRDIVHPDLSKIRPMGENVGYYFMDNTLDKTKERKNKSRRYKINCKMVKNTGQLEYTRALVEHVGGKPADQCTLENFRVMEYNNVCYGRPKNLQDVLDAITQLFVDNNYDATDHLRRSELIELIDISEPVLNKYSRKGVIPYISKKNARFYSIFSIYTFMAYSLAS